MGSYAVDETDQDTTEDDDNKDRYNVLEFHHVLAIIFCCVFPLYLNYLKSCTSLYSQKDKLPSAYFDTFSYHKFVCLEL